MSAKLTRSRLFEGEQMRSKGRHIGWMKPDGTQVEEPDETYRNFHGAIARDGLGYTGKTMDEAHKQAHLDGHVRYSRGQWLNLSFHHDRPEAHENAIKLIHKYGGAARKGINIDVEGHPSGEGSADSFMETGNADDAIDFIHSLRKPQRQMTDIARARKFKFGESVTSAPRRAWITPHGETHRVTIDDHDHYDWITNNLDKIDPALHSVDGDHADTLTAMLHAGWIRKANSDSYTVGEDHEHRVRAYHLRTHPEEREIYIDVRHRNKKRSSFKYNFDTRIKTRLGESIADLLIRARLLEAVLADGIMVQKVSEKPFLPPLGYQGRVTARQHLKFNIVHPQYGVIGEIGGVLHTSRKPKPTMRRDMSDVYAHAWASHKGQPISKGDFDMTAIHLTHHPDTGEKLAERPHDDNDYARIHPHVKNLLGPARLRGVLGQLKRHGIHRVYSTMRTTGVRGVERPRKPGEPISFFEPPRSVVPPFRLREGELVEVWL